MKRKKVLVCPFCKSTNNADDMKAVFIENVILNLETMDLEPKDGTVSRIRVCESCNNKNGLKQKAS